MATRFTATAGCPGRRYRCPGGGWLALALLLTAGWPGGSELPAEARGQDPQDVGVFADPLVFGRLDPEARDLAVTVVFRADGSTRPASGRMLLVGSEEIYLRSAAVAGIFKASRFWQGPTRQLTLRVRDHSFVLTAGSRLVLHDEGEMLLPVPVLAIDGDLWLPVVLLTRLLGPVLREAVVWDGEQRELQIGSASFNVTGLRLETLTRATAVHLLCTEPLSFRAYSPERGSIVLKIYGGEVDPAAVSRAGRRGLVTRVQARQFSDHAKVYVKVDELVGRFRTSAGAEGHEIVLVVEEEQVSALPEPVPRGRLNVRLEDTPLDVTRTIDVRTVVIDPGHGGVELGKVGGRGVMEKDVNLAVARELARYLERKSDVEVVLTRDGDEQLGLAERTKLANRAGGDLFISLHCNGWFNEAARGVETYFLSPAKTEWSENVAAEENRGLAGASEDVSFIVWELVQNQFISSSSDLAEVVQEKLCRKLSATNRGVKQAGFRVLVGAYMPAVLVEMGFLSNPAEERRLAERSYQRRAAEALGEAILEFKERYAHTARRAEARSEEDW